jgi:hypothetical protein
MKDSDKPYNAVKKAVKRRLPIQIHTSIQEGNENNLTNSQPTDFYGV